jgi:hypothetical protein
MLQPEPRLLKFLKLTEQPRTQHKVQLSAAAQALIIHSLLAGREREAPEACTALAVRRKQGVFSIRSMGAGRNK